MNGKQLLILVVLGLVLGGAGLIVRRNQDKEYQASTLKMGDRLLGDFELSSVAGLRIASGTNSPLDVIRKGENWVVVQRGDYPANFSSVSELVRKLWEMKIARPVSAGPSRWPLLELTPTTATRLDLLDSSGKSLKSLLLGLKRNRDSGDSSPMGGGSFPDGRFVKVGEIVSLVADPIGSADLKALDWLSKDFFKVEKPKRVSVKHLVDTNSYTLSRDTEFAEWKLADATADEKVDSAKTGAYSSILSYPSFSDIVLDRQPNQLGLETPTVATVETTDGFTYVLNIGTLEGENYPVKLSVNGTFPRDRTSGKEEKAEDKEKLDKEFKEKLSKLEEKLKTEQAYSRWTYLVTKWTVDQLMKERHTLLVDKKADEKKEGLPPTIPDPFPELEPK